MQSPAAFGIVLLSSLTLVTNALAGPPAAQPLEGTWVVAVSVDPAVPVGDFTALETYSRGGGLVTANDIDRSLGVGVGQGAWERVAPDVYRASILFFLVNPDGSRAGSIAVRHTVRILDSVTYVGEGEATVRAADGTVVTTGPFTSAGRRLPAGAF